MAFEWKTLIGATNVDTYCGHTATLTPQKAIDGAGRWVHIQNEVHWLIIDLLESYNITKVRGRSNATYDPNDVDIFVSDDKGAFGAAVKTGITTWVDTNNWVEINLDTPKSGRYIKIQINSCQVGTNLEFGGEVATNFGHLRMRAIDRNVIKTVRDDDGKLCEVYSHVCDSATGNRARVTPENKRIVQCSANIDKEFANHLVACNCQEIGGGLVNTGNRFRPSYKADYDGWMGVVDAAYTFPKVDLKIAAEFGYATGDRNPLVDEKDQSYNGFVGLLEAYAGYRVPSVFVLDARKLKRPLTSRFDDRDAQDDASFSDIYYIGTGATWFPIEHNVDKFKLNPNVLFYWKEDKTKRFDPCACGGQGAFTDKDASRYLGAEFNIRMKYELLDSMLFTADFALFFPGNFYDQVKGIPLPGDVFSKLDLPDGTSVDSRKFRLGNDTAWILNMGLIFKF